MKVAVVAPGVPIPVGDNYGGIERAAEWMAETLAARGHDVTVFCNTSGPVPTVEPPFKRVSLLNEPHALIRLGELTAFDAVHDWSHLKPLRLARLKNYLCTAMWTDINAPGRTVYPSQSVREAFHDPSAPVIPIGMPVPEDIHPPEDPPRYVVAGRIAAFKGVDLSIRLVHQALPEGTKLTVVGYVGPLSGQGADYYAMTIRRVCERYGHEFVANPNSLTPYIRGAAGILHLHRWLESFSIVAAEALLNGVPMLTTDVGAPQEWVRLTDGGNVAPLKELEQGKVPAAATEFFATNWKGRRAGFVKRAAGAFDIAKVAVHYEKLYERGAAA